MSTYIWDNIGPGNGLLPHGTKQLPETVDLLLLRLCSIHLRTTIQYKEFENYTFKFASSSPRNQWVKTMVPGTSFKYSERYLMQPDYIEHQFVNILRLGDTYIQQWNGSSMVKFMVWHQFNAKPSPELIMTWLTVFCTLMKNNQWDWINIQYLSTKKIHIVAKMASIAVRPLSCQVMDVWMATCMQYIVDVGSIYTCRPDTGVV